APAKLAAAGPEMRDLPSVHTPYFAPDLAPTLNTAMRAEVGILEDWMPPPPPPPARPPRGRDGVISPRHSCYSSAVSRRQRPGIIPVATGVGRLRCRTAGSGQLSGASSSSRRLTSRSSFR